MEGKTPRTRRRMRRRAITIDHGMPRESPRSKHVVRRTDWRKERRAVDLSNRGVHRGHSTRTIETQASDSSLVAHDLDSLGDHLYPVEGDGEELHPLEELGMDFIKFGQNLCALAKKENHDPSDAGKKYRNIEAEEAKAELLEKIDRLYADVTARIHRG